MKRRDSIAVLGATPLSAWRVRARAQTATSSGPGAAPSSLPLVGFLNSASPIT
jgi:hypothetical protein